MHPVRIQHNRLDLLLASANTGAETRLRINGRIIISEKFHLTYNASVYVGECSVNKTVVIVRVIFPTRRILRGKYFHVNNDCNKFPRHNDINLLSYYDDHYRFFIINLF